MTNANRAAKQKEIEAINARLQGVESVIVTVNKGLTVKQLEMLRGKLRAEGGTFKIAKNTLVTRALEGTKFTGLADLLKGPTGIAVSKDPIAAARAVYSFAKDNEKLEIVGGAMSGEIIDLATIKYIATLPSMDGLRSKLIGILQAPGAQLARLANAYATKGDAPAVAE